TGVRTWALPIGRDGRRGRRRRARAVARRHRRASGAGRPRGGRGAARHAGGRGGDLGRTPLDGRGGAQPPGRGRAEGPTSPDRRPGRCYGDPPVVAGCWTATRAAGVMGTRHAPSRRSRPRTHLDTTDAAHAVLRP